MKITSQRIGQSDMCSTVLPCPKCRNFLYLKIKVDTGLPSVLKFECPKCKEVIQPRFNPHSLYHLMDKDGDINLNGERFLWITG